MRSASFVRRRAARLVVAAAMAAAPLPSPWAPPALAQQPRREAGVAELSRFEEDIARFERADREQPPPAGAVLFVGSSSIRLWDSLERDFPGRRVINRGFGGSELGDVVHFADRIIVPYRPRVVVVYAGDNDLEAGKSPERIFADYKRLVAALRPRLPATRIVYVSIKPSVARRRLLPQMRRANALIRRYAAGRRGLAYVDVFTPMLDSTGAPRPDLFVEDGLHMNAKGYAIWRQAIAPVIR